MTLALVAENQAFVSVTAPHDLVDLYVRSERLLGVRGSERPEAQVMRALANEPPPQFLEVIGPSGAGKTSLILRVLADLAKRSPTDFGRPHEVLVYDVGDDPARLVSPAKFMHTIVQLIARQRHRFGNVDPGALEAAAAEEVTRTGAQVDHRATFDAKVVSYSASLREAYESSKFGEDPARSREDFEDVLELVSAKYRPVIVIDDTEHFVRPGAEGVVVESVTNLFHHGVRTLAELQRVDVVVAMHPRYEEVDAVRDVSNRFGFRRVEVPSLSPRRDEPGLRAILERRLERHRIESELDAVIAPDAVAQLEGAYFLRDHDLRQVLDLAAQAATAAHQDGAERIERPHLQPLLEETR